MKYSFHPEARVEFKEAALYIFREKPFIGGSVLL